MISIVIVTCNSRQPVGGCLASLAEQGLETVVVDNASSDGTGEFISRSFPAVQLVASPKNLGFAGAANLGASHCQGSALLFLNPDTVCRGPLQALEEVLEGSRQIVAVAPRLIDSEGRPQVGFNVRRLPTAASLIFEILGLNRLFPNNPINRRYRCLDVDPNQPAEIEQPAGACLLVRRSRFENCGGFDEGFYPLWFEDVDLCLRLRQQGGTILYWPHVSVQHEGGHSLGSVTFSEKQIYWYRNLLYYVHKHLPGRAGCMVRGALVCGMGLRIVAELLGTVVNRRTPVRIRGERVRAYWRAAKLSLLG